MISGKASITTTGYNESYTFDGSNVKVNVTSPNNPVVYTGKYSLLLDITKDGKFSFEESLAGSKLSASGTWNFNTGIGEEKRKESVIFSIGEVAQGDINGYNLFNRSCAGFLYKIKELRNKKIVINSSGKIYSDPKGYYTLSTEYIFEQ